MAHPVAAAALSIPEQLDALVADIGKAVPDWDVTRHVFEVTPPCILVDLPTITEATLRGFVADIRVSVITGGVGDSVSTDPILLIIPALSAALGTKNWQAGRFTLSEAEQFPSYTSTIQYALDY